MLELTEVPKSLVVIGSGAVGVEFASMYARFGAKVTIVEVLPRIVPVEDEEISRELAASFKRQGIAIYPDTRVERMTRSDAGVEILARSAGDKTETFRAEKVLMAVGRRPLTDGIGLEAAGIATEKGYVKVDAFMRTNVPGVYAIGDVLPTPALAHVASAEGIVAVEHMAGRQTRPDQLRPGPRLHVLLAGGRLDRPDRGEGARARLRRRRRQVPVLGHRQGPDPRTRPSGFVKIVAEKKYDEVLGVHIVGPSATELIAEAGAALKLEATSEELVRTIHAHPTLSEAIHEAAEAVGGHAIHI